MGKTAGAARCVEAEAEFRLALEQFEASLGADHPRTLTVHSTLASALDGQGRHTEAELEHRKALAMALAAHGEKAERVATFRQRLGASINQQGRSEEAVELLESALALQIELETGTTKIATARFDLAKALWDSKRDRDRARSLARVGLDELGDESPKTAEKLRTWLAKRGAATPAALDSP